MKEAVSEIKKQMLDCNTAVYLVMYDIWRETKKIRKIMEKDMKKKPIKKPGTKKGGY